MSDSRNRSSGSHSEKRSWKERDAKKQQNSRPQSNRAAPVASSKTGFQDDDVMNFVVETLNRRHGKPQESTSDDGGYKYLKPDWLNDLHLDSVPEVLAHRRDRPQRNGRGRNHLKNRVTRPGANGRSQHPQGSSGVYNVPADFSGAAGTSARTSAGSSQWNKEKITVSEYLTETEALERRMAEIHRELAMLDGDEPRNGNRNSRDMQNGFRQQPSRQENREQERLLLAMEEAVRDKQKEIERKERELERRQRMLDMDIRSTRTSLSDRIGRLTAPKGRRRSPVRGIQGRTTELQRDTRRGKGRLGQRIRQSERGPNRAASPVRRGPQRNRKRSPPRRRTNDDGPKEGVAKKKLKTTEDATEAISDDEMEEQQSSGSKADLLELEEISEISDNEDEQSEHHDELVEEEAGDDGDQDEECDEHLHESDFLDDDEAEEVSERSEPRVEISREYLAAALEAEMIEVDISDEEPEPEIENYDTAEPISSDEACPDLVNCGPVADISDDELPLEPENNNKELDDNGVLDASDISEEALEQEEEIHEVEEVTEPEHVELTDDREKEHPERLVDNGSSINQGHLDLMVEETSPIADSPASPDPEDPVVLSSPASPELVEYKEMYETDATADVTEHEEPVTVESLQEIKPEAMSH